MSAPASVADVAAENGWQVRPLSYFGYWTYEFNRSHQRLQVRFRNGRVTALTHCDGSGVILQVKQRKRETALEILREEP